MRLATVERLEINVETNAGNAASQLKSLADAVQSVSKSAAKQTPVPLDTQKLISAATKVDVLKAKYEALAVAMNKAFIAGDTNKAWQLRGQMLQVEDALAKATAAANQNASATARVGTAARGAAHGGISNFLASLKRIAFYRFIRSIIKGITEAFQEGLKNAYTFSKGLGGPLSKAMDELASKSYTMKNQLGAAFGELLTTIMPVVIAIVNAVRTLANALSQLFAALGGRAQYKYAKDIEMAWDDAAGAAGDYKKTILGFDEINRLDAPGGGGGASALDPSAMFEYRDLPPWAEKFSDFASDLKITLNDVLFDWDNLTGEQIAEKVIVGLGGLVGAAVGFTIGGVPGAVVGTLIGVGLTSVFSTFLFDHDGKISKNEALNMVCTVAAALVGGVIGFALGGPAGAAIGATVGAGLWLLTSSALFKKKGAYKDQMLNTLSIVLAGLAGAAIGFVVGGPAGAIIGATVAVGITMSSINAAFADGTDGKKLDEAILESLRVVLAAVAGAAIGFVLGGPFGAALGAVIAVGVTLFANSVEWDKGSADRIRETGTKVNLDGFSHGGGKFPEFTLGAGATGYASGGFPSQGSLFVAGEAGAELVSTSSSGQTQVSNTNQIAASVSVGNVGVVQAINDLIRAVENKDTTTVVTIGDRDVYRANQRGQQKVGRSLVATV